MKILNDVEEIFAKYDLKPIQLPEGYKNEFIKDSKKLSEKRREELFDVIIKDAIEYSIITVDNKTIDKYLNVLQNSFHIELVRPFHSNLRKELTKMSKIYFKDFGLRNCALNRFFDFKSREDQGSLLENYIHKRLSDLYDKDSIKFWRTTDNREVDFIITTSFNEGIAFVSFKISQGGY